jgi:hypothetical protein
MRISARPDDRGFTDRVSECEAYLDGVKLTHCLTADEELGYAECCKLDDNGNVVVSKANPDEIETEIRKGVVRVVVPYGFLAAR